MTRGTRWLLALVIGALALLLATLGTAAATVYRSGTVAVEIEGNGHDIRLGLPAGLVGAAIALTPASAYEEAAAEIRPLIPALEAGWRELADAPDFVLVDFRSAEESVRVEKTGSRLVILVDAPDARFRIGVPLETVGSLLDKLG
jgi:hypothetical protein